MDNIFQPHYIQIVLATLASMVIGFIWYSPMLFGDQWMKLMGWDIHDAKLMTTMKARAKVGYLGGLVSSLVTALVVSYFIQTLEIVSFSGALALVTLLWLGFVVTTLSGSVLWEGKPKQLYFINIFYYLVHLMIIALILL